MQVGTRDFDKGMAELWHKHLLWEMKHERDQNKLEERTPLIEEMIAQYIKLANLPRYGRNPKKASDAEGVPAKPLRF